MVEKQFPLLDDSEPIFEERQILNLYDEDDFISNIKGDYEDKAIYDWSSISPKAQSDEAESPDESFKTDAAIGREEARESVRQKRSAAYLQDDPSQAFRKELLKRAHQKESSTKSASGHSDYSKYSQNLRQDQYILAAFPASARKKSKKKETKDSYDFLRKSQVYQDKSQNEDIGIRNQELDLRKLNDGEKEKK